MVKVACNFEDCHTSVAALTRVIAHKHKVRVVYTAHEFHFYKRY